MIGHKRKRLTAVVAALLLIVALVGFTSGESEPDGDGHASIPIYADGILIDTGLLYHETTYVTLRTFVKAADRKLEFIWDEETQTATVEADGLSIIAGADNEYLLANDRAFYLPEGILIRDGELMLPIREIARVFGLDVEWIAEEQAVSIDVEGVEIIPWADEVYDETDLYWLSRIIFSESGNQPLEGKIGVGNVVLNRVLDPSCPDSVYDVVFDDRYGVQFHPVETGAIYLDPCDDSVIAAKACLEGYVTVGDSLYFVNPETGISGWFMETRQFVASIGDHDFYA